MKADKDGLVDIGDTSWADEVDGIGYFGPDPRGGPRPFPHDPHINDLVSPVRISPIVILPTVCLALGLIGLLVWVAVEALS